MSKVLRESNYPIRAYIGKNKTRKSALVENMEYLCQCVPGNKKLVMWIFFWRSPSKQGSEIRWSSHLRLHWDRYADDSLWGKLSNGVKSNRLVLLVNSHWINYYCSSGEKASLSHCRAWLMGGPWRVLMQEKSQTEALCKMQWKNSSSFQCSKAFVISISWQMNFWQKTTYLGSIYPMIARVWVLDRCCLSRAFASG